MSTPRTATAKGRGSNPLNWDSPDDWVWTTVNTAETLVGVLMPLTWAFWEAGIENGMRRCFCDFGVLRRSEITDPPMSEVRFTAVFQGRYAVSVNEMRKIGDRMLGTDGDAVEEQIFGSVVSGIAPQPQRGRYPVVLAKMPGVAYRLPKRLLAWRRETDAWWRQQTAVSDPATGAERFLAARERFERTMHFHAAATMLAQAAYDRVLELAESLGLKGLERRLVTGYGDFEEAKVAADLWGVSRDRMSMDDFVAHHGYHGPREGTVDSRSWRLDRTPLHSLVERYQTMPDSDDPGGNETDRTAERLDAERRVLAAAGRLQRARVKAVLGFARRHVPLREVSKAAFLQCIDVGRSAARDYGTWLVQRGAVGDADDVFYLYQDEVADRLTEGLRDIVAARKEERARYEQSYLPDMWKGTPEPIPLVSRDDHAGEVEGLPVSSGTVEGRARVVIDLDVDDEIEPGEILVCETTDPSWASWFLLASALVIDIGGVMSHGALVAREMGVPCVINTRNGTRRIKTGDLLSVDGDTGIVKVLERAT